MSSEDLTFWRALERIEGPLGYKRNDIRIARLAYLISLAHGGRPRDEEGFMPHGPEWQEHTLTEDPESTLQRAEVLHQQLRSAFGQPDAQR